VKRSHAIDPVLAAALAARRRAVGLSQNELALRLGLSESVITKCETCRVPVSPERRAAIERALAEAQSCRARPEPVAGRAGADLLHGRRG
jgi:DNA-binding transcriptional regulator YdaS (Cro superfamily)